MTALAITAASGDLKMLQFLLSLGAAVDPVVEGEQTPLMLAAIGGNTSVAEALVAAGASVQFRGKVRVPPCALSPSHVLSGVTSV